MRWGEQLAVYDSSLARTTREQMENYLHTKGYFNGSVEHEIEIDGQQLTSNYIINEEQPYTIDTVTYRTQDSAISRLLQKSYEERLIEEEQVYDQEKLSQERERIETLLKNNGFFDFSRQYDKW